jgi:hypothetical protein
MGTHYRTISDSNNRRLQGLGNCVQQPTQDDFAGSPASITFVELLDGNRLLASWGVGGRLRAEDLVDGFKQDAASAGSKGRSPLHGADIVINIDVDVLGITGPSSIRGLVCRAGGRLN